MVGKKKKKTVKSKIALASKHSCAQLVGSVVWNYDLYRTSLDQRKTLEFGVVMIHSPVLGEKDVNWSQKFYLTGLWFRCISLDRSGMLFLSRFHRLASRL